VTEVLTEAVQEGLISTELVTEVATQLQEAGFTTEATTLNEAVEAAQDDAVNLPPDTDTSSPN